MSIEEIAEQTKIEFPRDLHLKEAESLLFYIAENLPANINYQTSSHKSISRCTPAGGVAIRQGTIGLTASINSLKNPGAFDSLRFHKEVGDSSRFSHINFEMVPGWELSDYRPEVKQLWDDIRVITTEYFNQRHG